MTSASVTVPAGTVPAGTVSRLALSRLALSRLARRLAAAVSTARTIRFCAPHRHKLRSSAARTSSSLGSSLAASSPAALITTPEMQ